MIAKPTVADLGIDPGAQHWQRSGDGTGALEIAFVQFSDPATVRSPAPVTSSTSPAPPASPTPPIPPASPTPPTPPAAATSSAPADTEDWVLLRVSDDPEGRVLVFDRHEWECFLDGARKGEFDDAAGSVAN